MLTLRPGERFLAVSLTFIAGFVDSVGFIYLGGVFLSFMSGNTTRSATALVEGNYSQASLAGTCIILFLCGVVLSAVISRLATRRWNLYRAREAVLWSVTSVFVVTSVLIAVGVPGVAMLTLSVGIGMMNSVFERGGEVSVSLTYMTGALVKMGQRFADTFFGGSHSAWLYHFLLWLCLSCGAITGALVYRNAGLTAIVFITVFLFGVAAVNQLIRTRRRKRDLPL